MRIGIDVDDTITETWKYVKPHFSKKFNIDLQTLDKYSYSKGLSCSLDEYYAFFRKSIQQYLPNVPIKKDVGKYINKLRKNGHEIYFITARSEHDMDNPYEVTKNYLDKNKIQYDHILVGCSEKDKIALENNIDLFIDDSVKNCTKVNNVGIKVILFSATYNEYCIDFEKVQNWEELYNLIGDE